ncbi:MAG: PAS domain S-box protein [Nitrospiraceae bacterium]|nr:PAS domain S-box protein [Nitrospiraceae bacterium]
MDAELSRESSLSAAAVREQVRLAFRQLPTMQLTSFVVALILAGLLRAVAPVETILAWLSSILVIVFSRIILYRLFRKVEGGQFPGEVWKNAYLLLTLLSGIAWGMSAFLIFPADSLALLSVSILVMASLSAATTVSHSSLRYGPAVWMVPALLPYALRCFLDGGEIKYTISILILFYLIALVRLSLSNHATIISSIMLKFENVELLDDVRKNAELLHLMFEEHNAVMLLVEPETGNIVDANTSAGLFYGYSVEELRRMNTGDLHSRPAEEVRDARRQALQRIRNRFIAPHRLADGTTRTVELHSSPIAIKDRVLLFTIIHDITERHEAEKRLIESEAGYRNLIDSITDGIFLHDASGRIVDLNKGAAMMYGRPSGELTGQTLADLGAPGRNDPSAVSAAMRRAFGGEPSQLTFWGARPGGEAFPSEIRFVPASYRGSTVVIAVARDITERLRTEVELLKAQKLEAIGVLAGGIAHDFNNWLQVVFGFLTVARLKIDKPERVLFMLDKAEKSLHMAASLTNQLLTFSKGGKPVTRTIALGPVIDTAAHFALSGSRSDCRIDIADDLLPVEADEGQIGQVVQNIVLNADQAMPNGGLIKISAENDGYGSGLDGRRWVRITITDSGAGIPEERLGRIFEPYFTTKETGSGLGLATSYSIVRNHGGSIDVISAPKQGSTFSILLPASENPFVPSVASGNTAPLRAGRVLVMDDEAGVLDSLGEMLREMGQDVEFAADGAAAIGKYQSAIRAGTPFDVVILDVTVKGGMGGEETITRLREFDPSVVAVVTSGYSDNAVVSDYASRGFQGFLIKPFDYRNLQSTLASVMK